MVAAPVAGHPERRERVSGEALRLFVIFQRPEATFAVVPFYVYPGVDVPVMSRHVQLAESLEQARALVPPGLYCMQRSPDDDPGVIETWL